MNRKFDSFDSRIEDVPFHLVSILLPTIRFSVRKHRGLEHEHFTVTLYLLDTYRIVAGMTSFNLIQIVFCIFIEWQRNIVVVHVLFIVGYINDHIEKQFQKINSGTHVEVKWNLVNFVHLLPI